MRFCQKVIVFLHNNFDLERLQYLPQLIVIIDSPAGGLPLVHKAVSTWSSHVRSIPSRSRNRACNNISHA